MGTFWVQGVVRNGQVVLDPPLGLPDGTVVTVMDYDPADDPRPQEPKLILTREEYAEFDEYFVGSRRHDHAGFAAFRARVEAAQPARIAARRGAA